MEHRQWVLALVILIFCVIIFTIMLCYLEIYKRYEPQDEESKEKIPDERKISERASTLRVFASACGFISFFIIFNKLAGLELVISLVLSFLCDVVAVGGICSVFPRKIATNRGEFSDKIYKRAGNIYKISVIFWFPQYVIGTFISLFFGAEKDRSDKVTEEKILQLVDEGNETGSINESQKEMINNIFNFDETAVSDIMTHRKDMVALPEDTKIDDAVSIATREGYSRIPVYKGDIDKITGVIYAKDMMAVISRKYSPDLRVKDLEREVMFVPESAKCSDVMKTMLKNKSQIAIVSDEFGGTFGVVSMEDLIEEIIGNIQDEYDNEEAEVQKINSDTYIIDGNARPEDVFESLGIKCPNNDKYDTMGGLIVDLLGYIPEEGEEANVYYEGNELTVLETKDNWIDKIRLRLGNDKNDKEE